MVKRARGLARMGTAAALKQEQEREQEQHQDQDQEQEQCLLDSLG